MLPLNHLMKGMAPTKRCMTDCCGNRACSAGRRRARRAVGMRRQKMLSSVCISRGSALVVVVVIDGKAANSVTVAEDACEGDMVAVSIVWLEVRESGGERSRRRLLKTDGMAPPLATLFLRGVLLPPATGAGMLCDRSCSTSRLSTSGHASSRAGGMPRYGSAYTR